MNTLRTTFASAVAAIMSIVITVAVTIGGELSAQFKTWLADLTGHHWVTKSWLSLIVYAIVFLISYLTVKSPRNSMVRTFIHTLSLVGILGLIVLTMFFSFEYSTHL